MKKEQKIIELRTAAKLKVAELRTKIAFAHSEAAGERARIMTERAAALDGLHADSTERFNVLAKYRALLASANERLSATVAQLKYEILQVKTGCEKLCEASDDDPIEEKEPRETVYCDGSEHSARIVARRLINKMPHIQRGGYLFVHILRNQEGLFCVSVSESDGTNEKYVSETLYRGMHTEDSESMFVARAREMFECKKDECGEISAAPMSRASDAIFGGEHLDDADNLVLKPVKNRNEGGDE